MHRSILQFTSFSLVSFALASCDAFAVTGSGTIETIEPDLDNAQSATEIEIDSGLTAIVSREGSPNVRITGDENLLSELIIAEKGQKLSIGLPDSFGGYRPTQPIVVEIALPELRRIVGSGGNEITLRRGFADTHLSLELSGGGTVQSEKLIARSLDIELSGGGELKLHSIETDALILDLSGGGKAELSGWIDTFEAHISGGGTLDAIECESRAASLELDGGSDASVHATEVLDIEASGGGTITYRGEPETIKKDLSGGAKLEKE